MTQRSFKSLVFAIVLLAWQIGSSQTTDNYQPGPDSKPQPGVPKGEVIKLDFDKSKIFPNTARDYWIYIPAQYNPDKPACVFICQDGIRWEAPTVFDNLIYKKEIPVTIGVFVAPGVVKTANANGALDRFNRSFEYDGLGDSYARFLLDELLPEVETKKTSDGRVIRLSHAHKVLHHFLTLQTRMEVNEDLGCQDNSKSNYVGRTTKVFWVWQKLAKNK